MKLNILERMLCLQLLPERASIADIKVVHQTKMALSFSEEEQKEYKFEVAGEKVTWDAAKQEIV